MAATVNPLLRWVFRLPNGLYDHNLGWVLGPRLMRLTRSDPAAGDG